MTSPIQFSSVIEEIDKEIGHAYLGGCIAWVDENFDGAWSKLLDQFEKVIVSGDRSKIDVMTKMYRTQVLGYIDAFKQHRSLCKTTAFLEDLASGRLLRPAEAVGA